MIRPQNIPLCLVLLLYSALIFLMSCDAGQKAFQQGDYVGSVLKSVNRLQKSPANKKAQTLLKTAYPLAVSTLEQSIKNKKEANDPFKWKNTFESYAMINKMAEAIQSSPTAMSIISHPVTKYDEIAKVKENAAEETYNAGVEAMMRNTREEAKRAYLLFKETDALVPAYKETGEMMAKAKENAILRVAVSSLIRGWDFESAVSSSGYNNEFVQFYRENQVGALTLPIHQVLTITNFRPYTETTPKTTTEKIILKDSVKSGERTVNNVKVPAYRKVRADVTVYTKTIISIWEIQLNIADRKTSASLENSIIRSSKIWTRSWAKYTGNSEALTDYYRDLTKRSEPYLNRDDLFSQTARDLESKLQTQLGFFYSKY